MDHQLEIICRSPGMRRAGIAHPAHATYPAGHWTADQIVALRADPMFEIREVPVSGEVRRSAAAGDPGGIEAQLTVAPGATLADQVTDNGAGPTQPHLDATPNGLGPAAPAEATAARPALGETVVPGGTAAHGAGDGPAFDNGRIEAIRAAIGELGEAGRTSSGRPRAASLETKLGFKPTPAEIDAALVETVAPEAVAKT